MNECEMIDWPAVQLLVWVSLAFAVLWVLCRERK
jgi:hypothetical protein